jgi:8-hydroxy-5-deazaflavin:NADPH oxidoreductase
LVVARGVEGELAEESAGFGVDDVGVEIGDEKVDAFAGVCAAGACRKAANTLSAEVLASDPHQANGQRVIFMSGDTDDAKAGVLALFQDAGFAGIDLGDLATGGAMQQIRRPLAGVNLIRV